MAIVALIAETQSLPAQVSVGGRLYKVRGTVFDSLTMSPASGADVWIFGSNKSTKVDEDGRFEIEDVPAGEHFFAFSSPALDSTGLGQLGATVRITDGKERVALATPSFRLLWNRLCTQGARAGSDSGIVWGTIRDANSDTRQSNAAASFSWYDLSLNEKKRYNFGEDGYDVRSDSTGTYYACGLPTEIRLSAEAMGSRAASGAVEFRISERRLTRFDLLVSGDMVFVRDSSDTTRLVAEARGTARLRGRVVDDKGKAVIGASVTFASLDTTVRTNGAGEFTLLNLPAGTHGLQARSIGLAPTTFAVELHPDQLSSLTVTMLGAHTLAPVNVRAERILGVDQLDFQRRLKMRSGYAIQGQMLTNRADIVSALRQIPSVQITRTARGQVSVLMSARRVGQCVPMLYVDRVRMTMDQIDVYRMEDFVGVEAFTSQFSVPVGFESRDCGVIIFWTKFNTRW
ncbi:MAG: carboxypeptidase regulatory-like domain-containing protein [Gemmatimonas sp.]